MIKQAGIWLDTKNAIIVALEGETEHTSIIESNIENRIYHHKEGDKGSFSGSHHISNEKKFDERIDHQTTTYIKKIIEHIKPFNDLYIFGPAGIKLKLKKEIENNHQIKINITAVEACDQLTNNQIVAKVKDHFK